MSTVLAKSPAGVLANELVDQYLGVLGFDTRPAPTIENLAELQDRHVLTVPFENLDYHFGREIHLDERVAAKVAVDRRGGGCYELNPAFHYLLLSLGYQSRILPGRSYRAGQLSAPYMHLVLEVVAEGETFLVDTGFRRNSRRPLRLGERGEQGDAHGSYRLQPLAGGEIDLYLDGEPLYRADLRGATVEDFAPTLWWWRTCPDSPFLQSLFCSLPLEDGRITLAGARLSISRGSDREVRELESDAEVLDAYAQYFGIVLPGLPGRSEHIGTGRGIRFE